MSVPSNVARSDETGSDTDARRAPSCTAFEASLYCQSAPPKSMMPRSSRIKNPPINPNSTAAAPEGSTVKECGSGRHMAFLMAGAQREGAEMQGLQQTDPRIGHAAGDAHHVHRVVAPVGSHARRGVACIR